MSVRFLFFHFKYPKRALGGGVASEVSALREVAAAIGDEPSGPTSERGNDGRWTARL